MVIPSPLEEHLGQVWDPAQHLGAIQEANRVVRQFIADMESGRVPSSTLNDLRAAADTLGTYAGYPIDACHMDAFLASREAAASYRETATLLRQYAEDMNALIHTRLNSDRKHGSPSSEPPPPPVPPHEADIPF